jgi:hypothetical protein
VSQAERQLCEVVWWRGYVKSRFYACDDDGEIVAASPYFRWRRGSPPPESKRRARRAFDRLYEQLAEEGWRPYGQGASWFSVFLERPRWLTPGLPDEGARAESVSLA